MQYDLLHEASIIIFFYCDLTLNYIFTFIEQLTISFINESINLKFGGLLFHNV